MPTNELPPDPVGAERNETVPTPADPGGAHAKGYSAEGGPDPNLPADGPLPMAKDAEPGTIVQPERDGQINPVGRSDPDYNPNDRVLER